MRGNQPGGDNLVSASSSIPAAMSPPPPPAPLPQTLADLATKQHEDHEAVVATLNSLSEENHTARKDRAEDRATLQAIAATLKTLQGQLADT